MVAKFEQFPQDSNRAAQAMEAFRQSFANVSGLEAVSKKQFSSPHLIAEHMASMYPSLFCITNSVSEESMQMENPIEMLMADRHDKWRQDHPETSLTELFEHLIYETRCSRKFFAGIARCDTVRIMPEILVLPLFTRRCAGVRTPAEEWGMLASNKALIQGLRMNVTTPVLVANEPYKVVGGVIYGNSHYTAVFVNKGKLLHYNDMESPTTREVRVRDVEKLLAEGRVVNTLFLVKNDKKENHQGEEEGDDDLEDDDDDDGVHEATTTITAAPAANSFAQRMAQAFANVAESKKAVKAMAQVKKSMHIASAITKKNAAKNEVRRKANEAKKEEERGNELALPNIGNSCCITII